MLNDSDILRRHVAKTCLDLPEFDLTAGVNVSQRLRY